MSKEFSKKFYHSKQWKDFREYYFQKQHGICEICGQLGEEVHHIKYLRVENIDDPEITMNEDNVQLLCKNCHNAVHQKTVNMSRMRKIKNNKLNSEYEFTADGQYVQRKNVVIVHGSPSSGKTHYVRENKGKYDIVIDLDYIRAALVLSDNGTTVPDVIPFALDVREHLYQIIEERKYYFDKVWVIAMLPKKAEREALAKRLRAELIHIDTSEEECQRRAYYDKTRHDKELQHGLIKKYFTQFEP